MSALFFMEIARYSSLNKTMCFSNDYFIVCPFSTTKTTIKKEADLRGLC